MQVFSDFSFSNLRIFYFFPFISLETKYIKQDIKTDVSLKSEKLFSKILWTKRLID